MSIYALIAESSYTSKNDHPICTFTNLKDVHKFIVRDIYKTIVKTETDTEIKDLFGIFSIWHPGSNETKVRLEYLKNINTDEVEKTFDGYNTFFKKVSNDLGAKYNHSCRLEEIDEEEYNSHPKYKRSLYKDMPYKKQ